MMQNRWVGVVSWCLVLAASGAGCADGMEENSDRLVSAEAALRVRTKLLAKPAGMVAATATFATVGSAMAAVGSNGVAESANEDGKPDDTGGDTGDDTGDDSGDTGDDENPTDCYAAGRTTTSCQHGGQTCQCTFDYVCDEEDGDCVCASVLVSVVCGESDRPFIELPR